MAKGDKEFTIDNDIAPLFLDGLPDDVRAMLSKLSTKELIRLGNFLNSELSKARRKGREDAEPKGPI